MINSRKLEDLDPRVAAKARQFQAECYKAGIDIIFTSTYRDNEAQDALYKSGRTALGGIVTNAKAGQSWHNYKLAFDFAPIVNGKIDWNNGVLWKRCGEIAESCGLEWAGRWVRFKEMAHCQWTGGLTLAQLQAGKRP